MNLHKISSTANDLVKHAVKLQKDKEYRASTGRVLVEGKNLLTDLLKRHQPEKLFLVEELLPQFRNFSGDIFVLDPHVAQKISVLGSPEGCFAEYKKPHHRFPKSFEQGLALDRLQDPGNVGTLLRTSLAFDIQAVFCIEPCCDVWSPKVLRAAKGAQFDLPVFSTSWEGILNAFSNLTFYVADSKGEDIGKLSPCEPWLLILGNEAHGASLPHNLSGMPVRIPMSSQVESLNVAQAGAIALYSLTKNL